MDVSTRDDGLFVSCFIIGDNVISSAGVQGIEHIYYLDFLKACIHFLNMSNVTLSPSLIGLSLLQRISGNLGCWECKTETHDDYT